MGQNIPGASVELDGKKAFVAALAKEHGRGLRRFLAARLREAVDDIPDLVQEVYLRLLRVPNHDTIRSPQAYLFTVAHHVLHQHKMSLAATPESVDLMDVLAAMETQVVDDPAAQLDLGRRLQELDLLLRQVPPRCRATFILHRRFGFTLDEIARQLGVSRPMVKKYLVKALVHCKQHIDGME
jgi:RNA polymerase sigma factor (sigma-70 family)